MARIIPKRTLEDIRFRNDIVEVIGSYITLKKAGSSFKACCPFHKEKTPSFHVNPQKQIYHCFGCGAGGDVFGFIMQQEGVDFTTAVKILAQKAGVELNLEEAESDGIDKAALYKLLGEVAQLYHNALLERKSAQNAREYLELRELSGETVKEFLIGYAPDRWDAVLTWAEKKKYKHNLVEASGLILKKDNASSRGGEYYDRFRNRLMFPVFDEQSRVIGFSGRTLSDEESAKYVNSPETPVFHKSRVLYALDKARRHIVENREAIVCEGQIDVIRCHQAGFNTAVASQGTAFTEDHVHILRRYADSVCIVFDPDKAGQDAAIRTATLFMSDGLATRIATLPKGEDPDSFIRKKGADAFKAALDSAYTVIGFQINTLSERENIGTEIGAMRVAKAVLATISQSPNAVQRAKLIQETAERLNLPTTALQDDLRHMMRRQGNRRLELRSESAVPEQKQTPKEEIELCEHMAHIADCAELGTIVRSYLPLEMISDVHCRTFVEAALQSQEKGIDIQEALRNADTYSSELEQLAAQVQMMPTKIRGEEFSHADAVKDLVLLMWRTKLTHERAELEKKTDERDI
ncbi:MAG: DNA primase, partial [Lentisphaerae bacterium]|nr:DNA primase [Lentisphaerota bacterium]